MFPQTRLKQQSLRLTIRWDNKKKIIIFNEKRCNINNALNEELIKEEVVAKFENTTRHGAMNDKTQTHYIEYYNLDVILLLI